MPLAVLRPSICELPLACLPVACLEALLPVVCISGGAVGARLPSVFADRDLAGEDLEANSALEETLPQSIDLLGHFILTRNADKTNSGHSHHGWGKVCRHLGLAAFPALHSFLCPLHLQAFQTPPHCLCLWLCELRPGNASAILMVLQPKHSCFCRLFASSFRR